MTKGGATRTAKSANGTRPLGEVLIETGDITQAKLRRALRYQSENGAKLGEALLRLGYITDDQLAAALAAQKKLPLVSLLEVFPNLRAVNLLTERFIRARQVVPVDFDGDTLILAMVNPLDVLTLDDVAVITNHEVTPVVTTQSTFESAVDSLFNNRGSLGGAELGSTTSPYRMSDDQDDAEDTSVVSLVDDILDAALKRRASDIHFEPQLGDMQVRIRVDGVLHTLTQIPNNLKGGIVSRVKIMGDMDISEKRLPQDGRATYRAPDQSVDLRIATLPSVHGESVILRLLDESMFDISLEELGMDENSLLHLRQALCKPHGQLLITGPTGSGKSTTLYAALEELNDPTRKIYTVEDPVERKIPGIVQSQVKPGIGLTFARMLRSLVRADPDIIMIGEVRDAETAVICSEASLTGHLVLSTLHTNDAASTITRLTEMGVPPYLVASSLECVVAQRLARRLCPHCREEVALTPESMTAIESELLGDREATVSRAVGCRHCFSTGYAGRVGLYEVLPMTKELRGLIVSGASTDAIRDHGLGEGMLLLREDGVRKVLAHLTTAEEVHRVTA